MNKLASILSYLIVVWAMSPPGHAVDLDAVAAARVQASESIARAGS